MFFYGLEMKFRADKYLYSVVLGAFCLVNNAHGFYGGLSPQNFNKMYYLATQGKVAVLRDAVNRGLNIDSVNPNGDTGLCIAIKRNNYTAYNSFRMSGANPRHQCTYRIHKQYQAFLASNKTVHTDKVVGNKESLYYNEGDYGWWPWILGGAAIGGGIWALSSSGGGGSGGSSSGGGDTPVIPVDPGYGLASYLTDYIQQVDSGLQTNSLNVDGSNPKASEVVDKIKFLPNMLNNYPYLKIYARAINGAKYQNLSTGTINLGDATVGLGAYQDGSMVINDGVISAEARNGAIGMVASNGATAINGQNISDETNSDKGNIRFIFKGSQEGDTIIGMYGDTHSEISNKGKIIGVTSGSVGTSALEGNIISAEDEGGDEPVISASNSGTMLGMALFDFYTGEDLSQNVVSAENHGSITLQAGNNNADTAAISLIGMGSYIDDNFLNGKNNPAYAEQMLLYNYGDINLAYQKTYNISSEALKLGDGGVIGIRADSSTGAVNQGNIKIDMQATTIATNNDVAAGMLSVHGAGLVNGTVGFPYDGGSGGTGGTIQIINEATSGGVFYGMLAAKGSGTQTGLYKWKKPFLHNYGLIDMQVSNSYGMASVAGGEMVNDGVINLGVENGQSYYTNNKGMYAAGEDVTEEVSLINNGIINVYSEQSAAIYNAFSGSVTQTNTGYIYLSNKATNSKVFGGNYSTAINTGDVLYKVGNSESFTPPTGKQDKIGLNVATTPSASVVTASGESSASKQYVVNDSFGDITIGGMRDSSVDYGGTFGTAGIQVSKQGSARNKGTMKLKKFDQDIMQFNVAMWLDSTATAEAYVENYGNIEVDAVNSIGIRNDSGSGASATNFGNIYAHGDYSYGMAVTQVGANLFNGRANNGDTDPSIYVTGTGAIGMYVKNGNAYNYGSVYLEGDYTTAFQLDGKDSVLNNLGAIGYGEGLKDITFYWLTNGAEKTFETASTGATINGYTLAKMTTDGSGGTAYLSKDSTVYVTGENSHLFVVEGKGSKAYNRGVVEVSDGATAIQVSEGGSAYNDLGKAIMTIKSGSTGLWGTDSGTTVGTTVGSNMYVENGTGMYVEALARADNYGRISVTGGTGIYIIDGSPSEYTDGLNGGSIIVNGSENIGVRVTNMAHFTNSSGTISVSSNTETDEITKKAIGIYADENSDILNVGSTTNQGTISVGNNAVGIYNDGAIIKNSGGGVVNVTGANSYGVYGNIDNLGDIIVSNSSSYGVYGSIENKGTITVNSGIGVKTGATDLVDNSADIKVNGGIGVEGHIVNTGTVTVNGGVGIKGYGSNSGTITNYGDAGVQVEGSFTNSGSIDGVGVGIEVVSGNALNQKSISMTNGTGILVDNGASATNTGTISIGSGYGFHIKDGGSGINAGLVSLSNNGLGVYVEDGGGFVNTGTISYHSKKNGACSNYDVGGECIDEDAGSASTSAVLGDLVFVENGASFVNGGTIDLGDANLDFDKSGNYVLAEGGTYKAATLSGNITVSSDIVVDGFEDTYKVENAFEGENNGISVHSESYLFDANTEDKGDVTDVTLNRKDFRAVLEEEELADFLEANYQAKNNENMYRALKGTATPTTFIAGVESEMGKKFYANLPRENMAVLRGLQNQEQRRILENGLMGVSLSADYFKTGKDGNGILSDYDDDVYSVALSGGKLLNRFWSVGGTLKAAYAKSDYDDVNSSRDNKILMALLPIMYKNNRFKFLTEPSIGLGFGSYTRKTTFSNSYDADTFDIYYGLYNHAEYDIDLKIAELVTEAEVNLQGISSNDAKEKGGFKYSNNDSVSLEAGIGVKLRKRIKLAKDRELMLALGTKYYHEMLDPYKDFTIGTSAANYSLKGYNEDKNRLRTAAEATYRDGSFALSAEVAHNLEKEENVEGGLGVRYHF